MVPGAAIKQRYARAASTILGWMTSHEDTLP